MALIQCHECQGKVSDHARTCPHCGAPVIATIKRKRKAALIELGVRAAFTLVVIVILIFMMLHLKKQLLAPLKNIPQQQQSGH